MDRCRERNVNINIDKYKNKSRERESSVPDRSILVTSVLPSLYFGISDQLISRFDPLKFRQSSNPSNFNPKPFQSSILPQDGQMFPYGYIWLRTPLRSHSSLCYEEQSTGKKKNVFQ